MRTGSQQVVAGRRGPTARVAALTPPIGYGVRSPFGAIPAARLPALLVILGFALVVARLHELYPPLAVIKPVLLLVITTTLVTLTQQRPPGEPAVPLGNTTLRLLYAYWAWMAVTVPTSIYRGYSLQLVIDLAPVMLFTTVIIAQRATPAQLRLITRGFLTVCGFYGVLLILFGKADVSDVDVRYYLSDSLDPNDCAAFLAMGAPLMLTDARRTTNSVTWRFFCWVLFAVVCGAIMRTGSRGGLIALVVGIGVVLASGRGIRAVAGALGVLTMLGVGFSFVSPQFKGRLAQIGDASSDYNVIDYGGRVQIWKRGMKYFAQDPLLGVGVGNFPTREGRQMAEDGISGKWSAAHNSYVQSLAELGLVGGLLFISLLFKTLKSLAAVYRAPSALTGMPHPEYLAALAAFACSAFFLSHAYFWGFFALIGLCALAGRTLVADDGSSSVVNAKFGRQI